MREGATRARVERLERVRAEAVAKFKAIQEQARKENREDLAKELEEEAPRFEAVKELQEVPNIEATEGEKWTHWKTLGIIEPVRRKATRKATKGIRKLKEVTQSLRIEKPEDIDKLGPEFERERDKWTHWRSLGIVEPARYKKARKAQG